MLTTYKDRIIAIRDCKKNIDDSVKIKIANTKDGIYQAKEV